MSVRGAAFLGIGAMVGAGIFALLGEAGAVAGSAVWLSFLLAGIVAALLGYTVVKLGVRYPSSGGLIAYLMQGFGNGRLVGIASWLGYFAAIVIVCSMVAVAFGSYATSLFVGDDAAGGWDNVFTSADRASPWPAINIVGSRVVDRAQSLIVVVLLAVFAVFIAVTLVDIDFDLLAFSGYPSVLGHRRERRAHVLRLPRLQRDHVRGRRPARPGPRAAAGDVRRPRRHDASSTSSSRSASSGRSPSTEVIGYGETAIAEAARPALGDAGFTMMAIAALLATASSVNATLYASGGLTAMLAEVGPVPALLRPRLAARPARRAPDHRGDRARRLEPRRPLGDRVGRQRLLAA